MAFDWRLLVAILVSAAGMAVSDSAPFSQTVRHVCRDDVKRLCPNLHDPVKILACLQGHETDVTSECASGLHRCPMYNCMDDVKQFCPEAEGTKGTLLCLWKHRSELSDKCWNQSIGGTKLGFLPESHACREDEQKFCSDESSLLDTMTCLQQQKLQSMLSPQCSRIVDNGHLFACVDEAQKTCPDITSISEMKGCIMQHNLKCSKSIGSADVPEDMSSPYPFCRLEIENLCRHTPPEGLYDCLHSHEDSVSKQCGKTLKASLEHRCKEERNNFCLNHFGQSLVTCLETVKNISKKCQKTLNSFSENSINQGMRLNGQMDSDQLESHTTLNILLTSFASFAFILMLVGVAYIVRKSRAGIPMDSLPSATTSTEYIRI